MEDLGKHQISLRAQIKHESAYINFVYISPGFAKKGQLTLALSKDLTIKGCSRGQADFYWKAVLGHLGVEREAYESAIVLYLPGLGQELIQHCLGNPPPAEALWGNLIAPPSPPPSPEPDPNPS